MKNPPLSRWVCPSLLLAPRGLLPPSARFINQGGETSMLRRHQPAHARGLESLGARLGLVLHRLPVLEGLVPFAFDHRVVNEHVLIGVVRDKAKPLLIVE